MRARRTAAAITIGVAAVSVTLATAIGPATGAPRAPAATHWTARPATYPKIARTDNVPVRMTDGVVLEAQLLRPALADGSPAPGRFPVILTQTPYNKDIPGANFENDYLVQRGYVQAIVDVRGTGSSEGAWDSFGARERRDGYELGQWAHALPGGNGSTALLGASYGAINQIFTAAQHPAGLKAIFPIVPMGDAYRDVFGSGGQIDTGFIPLWAGLVTGTGLLPTSALKNPSEAVTALLGRLRTVTSFIVPTFASALTGGANAFDGDFYQQRSPLNVIDQVNVPTFIVGGEYDLFQRGEPMLYNALAQRHVPVKLLIGPWTHVQAAVSATSGFTADGAHGLNELELRWFDRYVRGAADATLNHDVAPTSVYRLGGGGGAGSGRFQAAPTYPTPATRYQALRLGGTAGPGKAGSLAAPGGPVPAAGTGTLPYNPLAGLCSQSTNQWTAGAVSLGSCSTDQRVNDATGAVYDLTVGAAGLRFDGPANARLFVSTTARDGMVTARLEDVAPNGSSAPLTAGWQVLSLRATDPSRSLVRGGLVAQPWHPDTASSASLASPGTIYELDVEIFPTAAALAPGHRLRLALQSSDTPHLLAPVPQLLSSAGGTITVYSDAQHPSALVLGVERG